MNIGSGDFLEDFIMIFQSVRMSHKSQLLAVRKFCFLVMLHVQWKPTGGPCSWTQVDGSSIHDCQGRKQKVVNDTLAVNSLQLEMTHVTFFLDFFIISQSMSH